MADSYGVAKEAEPDLEQDDRVARVYQRWQDARDGLSQWRTEARESYEFDAGQQWSEEDIALLNEQERPAVVFNRGSVMVDAVCGLEVSSRQEITYFPREQGDAGLAELETAAAHWVIEQCHGEDEESEAFRDALISGIGVTEMKMDYESNPDGNIVIERRDPLKVFIDPAASKRCLEDARYVFYADWMDNKEIEETWPDRFSTTTPWDRLDEGQSPQNADLQFLYKDTDGDFEKHKDQSLVIQYQCYTREPYYRVLDPNTREIVSIDKDKFGKIRKAFKEATGEDLQFVKQTRKVYWRGFYCGRTELEWKKAPYQEGFTFKFITAKRDRNRKQWYGIWRSMKDPQRWANKWLSQILHIINTNAKGGAFVETNALKDPRKATEQWAASNPLIELNEGGIGKIKERTPAQTPTGLDKLMNFAFESLPFVSGINLEALGLANREQAGVLEAQRRKAAYGILAPLFDALRLYRKQQGRMLLWFIREFISDGRLIRVVGRGGLEKYIPLSKQKDVGQYDVIVDQSPNSPDFREKTWEAMKEILPVAMKEGIPIPPSVFDYAPLPTIVAQEWKQMMAQRGQIPPQVQKQMQEMQQAVQKLSEENRSLILQNSELKVGAQVDILKIHAQHAQTQEKNQTKVYQAQLQAMTDRMNTMLEAHSKTVNAQLDRESEERKHVAQLITDFKISNGKVVVDTASSVIEPVQKVLDAATKAVESMKVSADATMATAASAKKLIEDATKKRTKKAVVKKRPDGSFLLVGEG